MNQQTNDQLLSRLDRLKGWPYPRYLMILLGVGFFFGFFDIITVGIALPVFTKQFHTTNAIAIWTITSSLIGYIIGSFLDSRISDVYSRKLSLILSILFFSLGSLLSSTSTNIGILIFWRFIIGMGIGAEIANISTYVCELSPMMSRGRNNCITVGLGFLGIAVVPFVGLALVPNFSWGWRLLFAIGGVGGLVILILRMKLPQPIRWLILQGKIEQAETELTQLESTYKKRHGSLPEAKILRTADIPAHSIKQLLWPPYLTRILFFVACWLLYYIGNYAWLSLNTKLFLDKGFDLTNSITLVAVTSIGFVIGSIFAVIIADRAERKWLLVIFSLLWTVTLVIIAVFPSVIIIYIFGFFASFSISTFIPLMYTYTAESFPTAFRATSVSISDGVGHIGGAFCGQIVFGVYNVFQPHGYMAAYLCMALTGLLVMILLLFGHRRTGHVLAQ